MKGLNYLIGVLAVGAAAVGDVRAMELTPYTPTHSAVLDASNMSYTQTDYRFIIGNSTGDSVYVNSMAFVPSLDWDFAIDMDFRKTGGFKYNFDQMYTFGDPIPDGETWLSEAFFGRSGEVDAGVLPGLYYFGIDVLGGDNNSASELLGTLNYELEVVDRIDLVVTGSASPDPVSYGGLVTADMTVENTGTRNFFVTTWYTSGFNSGSDSLPLNSFRGDWFNVELAPGEQESQDHSTYDVPLDVAAGTYTGSIGVYGGVYDEDQHAFAVTPSPTVVVVPEPATATWALAVTGLTLLRRRR